jgi:hypothetical protein
MQSCDCVKHRKPQNSFKTENNPPPLNCIFNAIAQSRHILRIPLRLKAPPTSLLVTPWTPQKTDRKCRLHMQRDCAKQRQPQNSSKTESTPHYSIAYATRLHKKDTTSESTPHYTHSPNETSPRLRPAQGNSRGGTGLGVAGAAGIRGARLYMRHHCIDGGWGRSIVYATPLHWRGRTPLHQGVTDDGIVVGSGGAWQLSILSGWRIKGWTGGVQIAWAWKIY